MLKMRPLDEHVPIQQQLGATASPAMLINIFTVAPRRRRWLACRLGARRQLDEKAARLYLDATASRHRRQLHVSELRRLGIGRAFPRGFHQSRVSRRARRPTRRASSPRRICSRRSRCRICARTKWRFVIEASRAADGRPMKLARSPESIATGQRMDCDCRHDSAMPIGICAELGTREIRRAVPE